MKNLTKLMLVMVVGLVMGGSAMAQKPQRTEQKAEKSASYSVFLNQNAKQPQNAISQINLFTGLENQEQILCSPLIGSIEPVVIGKAGNLFGFNQTPPYDYFIVKPQETVF